MLATGLRFERDGSGDFLAALRDYEPDDEVPLTVVHSGTRNEEEGEIKIGERPQ